MKESLGISQEQKQVQRLTPQQVQFGKMLEMSQLEIEEKVRQEIEDNPAIEVASPAESEKMLTEDGEVFKESSQDMQLADFRDMDDMPDGYDTAHTAGTPESENPAERSSEIPSYRLKENNYSPDDKVYEPTIVSENSLIDFLTEQVNERNLTDEQMQIADYIIGEIDDNGYLTRTVPSMASDIAFQTGLDISDEEVANVLQIIRDLDPAGVAATDLRDCLLLQLERLGGSKRNMHAYEIIDKHFEEFSKKHFDKIMSAMSISEEEFKDAMLAIRALNPKPGSLYNSTDGNTQHIIPDFNVEVDGNNVTLTLLNNIPDLQIEQTYQLMYDGLSNRKAANRNEEKANVFVKDKYESAAGFIKMLRQRQETLFNTMQAIVNWQRDFFLSDDEATLKPMVLKDISAITGYDISVISRATAGKYVSTQRGIYPIKFFFNEGLKHESGEDVSSREIQKELKNIIEAEDKKKPFSDEIICKMLQQKGYEIARRTIAKYREKLGYPVARLRKEL